MTEKEVAFIKSVFGKHYSPEIVKHLAKKKMKNSDGNPFSSTVIRGIVGGFQPNAKVELEILKFATTEAAKQAKIEKQRAAITKHIKL